MFGWITRKEAREIARDEAVRAVNEYKQGVRYRAAKDDCTARQWSSTGTHEQGSHVWTSEIHYDGETLGVGIGESEQQAFLMAYDSAIRDLTSARNLKRIGLVGEVA